MIKYVTGGVFALWWFVLAYVCYLFKCGDLHGLENSCVWWMIAFIFVEKVDEDSISTQRGRCPPPAT